MSVSQKGAIEKFTSHPFGEGQNRSLDEKRKAQLFVITRDFEVEVN